MAFSGVIPMERKGYSHFRDKECLFKVLEEIKARVNHDYSNLAIMLCKEIKEYYRQIPKKADESGKKVKPKLLVGLSGGVDSSVVVYLAAKAVGVENVVAITMPARGNDKSVHFSNLVREKLGMNDQSVQYVIPISEIVRKEIETINSLRWKGIAINAVRKRQTDMDRMRIGNFASRARIAILYDIARKVNGKVLGTGNRPEFVQGYAAKYGTPISFDFGILDELYKTDIYELATVLNLPEEIINKTPSTGYFPGQTHEEELGATCEEQDALAFLLFEKRKGIDEIVKKYKIKKAFVKTMLKRYERSKEKRMLRQPHIKLGFIEDGNVQ
ncbi:MAG: NAD(+) synthase [Deltaproteobacteria bacterium]|nr:MAG: NAD(+) synthase [Deltaproteobacteria bacterium]